VTRVAIRDHFAHTLTGKALLRLAVLGAAVLVLFGAVGAVVLYRQITAQESERLALLAAERARVAEQVLGHVAEMHRTVRDEFVRRWPDYRNAATARRFDSLLERDPEGAWRSRAEISDGRQFPTGWVRKGTLITDEVRQRVVLFHDLSRRYGPGAATRNDNLYFVGMPEQSNMGYDPTLSPTWSNDVPSDFDQLSSHWGRMAYEQVAPYAPTRWSPPEIDDVSPTLGPVFAALTPVHADGQQVATIGTTLVVKEFLNRVLPTLGAQARYVAIHADGRPLTDTRARNSGAAPLGELHLRLGAITESGAASYAGYSDADDVLYALARIDGPGWYVVTMLPGAELRARAAAPLLWTLGFGACALLLPLAIVSAILRRQVAAPLGALTHAAESLAAGDTTVRLPANRADELGRLSIAFNNMATKVAERDAALREDKRQIEEALHSLLEAQKQLAQQREALHQSEKMSALGSLLAGVAHELNNPLAVVVGRAFQLEESATHPIDRERATQLRLAAERCARIVRTFLAMARRQEATRAAVHVEQIVRDALELLGYALQTSNVQVLVELDDALPPVHGDADQLSQVFLNLITNAQQAMAQISGTRKLIVRAHRSDDGPHVVVELIDSGPGVPAELAGRIFDPYFTTKPIGEGTGVGLAVSLGIVQAHGGTLSLSTTTNAGAHFIVSLPVAPQTADVAQRGDTAGEASPPEGLCVLVVDDEAGIADWLRDTLEAAGHGVAVAHDGVQALRFLDDQSFDIVLTDLKMPQMDGPTLVREILVRHPQLAGHVVAMTGDSLSHGAREFVREHALPLLHKPFDPRDLWAALRRAAH